MTPFRSFFALFLLLVSFDASAFFYRVDAFYSGFAVVKHVTGTNATELCQDYLNQRGTPTAYNIVSAVSLSPTSAATGNLCTMQPSAGGSTFTVTYGTPSSVACTSTSTQFALPKTGLTCAPVCNVPSGTRSFYTGTSSNGEGPSAATVCGADQCSYTLDACLGSPEATINHGLNGYTCYVTASGSGCTPPVGAPTVGVSADPKKIYDQSSKATVQGERGKSCVTVNGEQVCSTALPNGSCVTTKNGSVVCASAPGVAPVTPPAPNTGTAGVAANPDAKANIPGTAGSASTSTTNYYSSTTVNGSTTKPPAGAADGSGTAGSSDSQSCSTIGNCTPAQGTFSPPGVTKAFGDLTSDVDAAKQRYADAISAIRAEGATELHQLTVGAGTLPSFPIDFDLPDLDISWHFDLDLNSYASQLSWIGLAVLLLAAFIAALIILS